MNNTNRMYMYERKDNRGCVSPVFIQGVKIFIDFGTSQQRFMDEYRIKCSCIKCRNIPYRDSDIVNHHLYKSCFVKEYWFWDKHGQTSIDDDNTSVEVDDPNTNLNEGECIYREMVIDTMTPDFNTSNPQEEPNVLDNFF